MNKSTKPERIAHVYRNGEWVETPFDNLKEGDRARLFELDGARAFPPAVDHMLVKSAPFAVQNENDVETKAIKADFVYEPLEEKTNV